MVKEHYNLNNHHSPPIPIGRLNMPSNNNKSVGNNNNRLNNKSLLVILRCQNKNVRISSLKFSQNLTDKRKPSVIKLKLLIKKSQKNLIVTMRK